MKTVLLGIGDYSVRNSPDTTIKTMALGSCIALIMYHPQSHTAGMTHIALPNSNLNPERGRQKPGYFSDSGVYALLSGMSRLTSEKNGSNLIVKMAGGAQTMDPDKYFNIGLRNIKMTRKILKKYGLKLTGEDTGGHISRSVSIDINTGKVEIWSPGRGRWNI